MDKTQKINFHQINFINKLSKSYSRETQNNKVLTDLDTSLTNVDGNTLSHVFVFFLGNKPFSE